MAKEKSGTVHHSSIPNAESYPTSKIKQRRILPNVEYYKTFCRILTERVVEYYRTYRENIIERRI
jgi:hypothetical protein